MRNGNNSNDPVVVFLGEFAGERIDWGALGRQLGCGVQRAATVDGLKGLIDKYEVIGVFVDCAGDPCLADSLRAVRDRATRAKLVVCYPLSRPILADELVAAGAFHSVPKPLNSGEVNQSIGFAWEAWSRSRRLRPTWMPVATAA